MLCALGHRVAMCCDILGVVGSSLKMVKFEPTTPNISQPVATGWPNARNMLRPTMLQYVALACFNSLAGDLQSIPGIRFPNEDQLKRALTHNVSLSEKDGLKQLLLS